MTTKSTTDWKPENPCEKCDRKEMDYYGCVNNLTCEELGWYLSAIDAQKKLLEYLVRWDSDCQQVHKPTYREIESMLKQLEEL